MIRVAVSRQMPFLLCSPKDPYGKQQVLGWRKQLLCIPAAFIKETEVIKILGAVLEVRHSLLRDGFSKHLLILHMCLQTHKYRIAWVPLIVPVLGPSSRHVANYTPSQLLKVAVTSIYNFIFFSQGRSLFGTWFLGNLLRDEQYFFFPTSHSVPPL